MPLTYHLRVLAFAVAFTSMWLLTLACADAQPATKKIPVPRFDAMKRAAALVDELYGVELKSASKDRDAALKLAWSFLVEAKDTNDDMAGKYTLLQWSAKLAAGNGDSATALLALEEWAQFDVPAHSVFSDKVEVLNLASRLTSTLDSYQNTVDAARLLLEEAVATDDFKNAIILGNCADIAAKKLKNVALVSSIRKRNDEVKSLQAEYAKVKPFIDALVNNPKDALANLEVGKYYALFKGDWDKGLALLADGDDVSLKRIAMLELEKRSDPNQLAKLWVGQADKLQGQAKTHALLRAYKWYQSSLGEAKNPVQRKADEAAMLAINEQLSPEYRIGEIASELRRLIGHNGPVHSVAMNADGSKIASGGADGIVRLWDAKTGKEVRRFLGHNSTVWSVAMTPDGKRIVSGGFDKMVRFWDPVSGRELKALAGHEDYVRAVAISNDGSLIVSGGDDRQLLIWDGDNAPRSIRGHDHSIFGVALTYDSARVLSTSLDRTARVWDVKLGKELMVFRGHTDTVLGGVGTRDSKFLTASTDKTLQLWQFSKTPNAVMVFEGHTGFVNSVAISPDGRRALSAGHDGKVNLWDVDQGKLLRVLEGHTGPVWSVAFSGDGRFAVTAGHDGTVRVWGGANSANK